jgi:hypothetical protein
MWTIIAGHPLSENAARDGRDSPAVATTGGLVVRSYTRDSRSPRQRLVRNDPPITSLYGATEVYRIASKQGRMLPTSFLPSVASSDKRSPGWRPTPESGSGRSDWRRAAGNLDDLTTKDVS